MTHEDNLHDRARSWGFIFLSKVRELAAQWFEADRTAVDILESFTPQAGELLRAEGFGLADSLIAQNFVADIELAPWRRVPLESVRDGRVHALVKELMVTFELGDMLGCTWPTGQGLDVVQYASATRDPNGDEYLHWSFTPLVSTAVLLEPFQQVGLSGPLSCRAAIPVLLQTATYLAENPLPGATTHIPRFAAMGLNGLGPGPIVKPGLWMRSGTSFLARSAQVGMQELLALEAPLRMDIAYTIPLDQSLEVITTNIKTAVNTGIRVAGIIQDGFENDPAFQTQVFAESGHQSRTQRWVPATHAGRFLGEFNRVSIDEFLQRP